MIRYALRCRHGHGFDAWFANSSAFEEQRDAGRVSCAICGDISVEKAVMAPSVSSGDAPARQPGDAALGSIQPASPLELAISALRRKIEATSDYVGTEFATEARRIHDGEADARSIWGEATVKDVRALADDGIPVTPLPFVRRRDD
ncbi:DUF1178 family protein [Limibaculum sp. M0105]|uniref:DUF1178 family protein n=1 Tax=Thermohalobaculum xanthum TaxID=2753746 RepID=A0A8J7M6G3_9RHOB|nr:DUF1178 family protein [Thermohalobaculum xanthum]MBK0399224.1 DUF1178 family protein [Thermohalobaculum xanthum]